MRQPTAWGLPSKVRVRVKGYPERYPPDIINQPSPGCTPAIDPPEESGALIGFRFDGISFPLEPKTVFYDWLYITFLYPWREWGRKLYAYAGFTDIEFNPHRSINCQARSCALFISLMKRKLLDDAVRSPSDFVQLSVA